MFKLAPLSIFVALLLLASCDKKPDPTTTKPVVVPLTPEEKLVTMDIQLSPTKDTSQHGSDNVKTFMPKDTVHGMITTHNATDGMLLTGRWFFVKSNLKIAENRATLAEGTNQTHFDLISNTPWPAGQYKLLVYLDSTAKDSAMFTVVKR